MALNDPNYGPSDPNYGPNGPDGLMVPDGLMAPWLRVFMAPWLRVLMAAGPHGCGSSCLMAAGPHASWLRGSDASWLRGSDASWLRCLMAPMPHASWLRCLMPHGSWLRARGLMAPCPWPHGFVARGTPISCIDPELPNRRYPIFKYPVPNRQMCPDSSYSPVCTGREVGPG